MGTKTMKDRHIPMTYNIKRILRNAHAAQMRLGVISEFVINTHQRGGTRKNDSLRDKNISTT